jgi:selenophosphate synthase
MAAEIAPEVEALLYDPQTSGGLLVTMAPAEAEVLLGQLPDAYLIGNVQRRGRKPLEVSA